MSLLYGVFLFLISFPVHAKSLNDRLRDMNDEMGYNDISGSEKYYFADRLGSFIQILLSFLGVVFLILIIYGGFLWMTARGNEQQVESAKKIITNSVIGTVIVMLAYAITWFVLWSAGESTGFKIN